jgi:hypothetical protein
MKLTELNPRWVGTGGEGITDKDGKPVPYREKIGISFNCPRCSDSHRVVIEFSNPPDRLASPRSDGHTWNRSGDTFDNLTLTPSIASLSPDCGAHFFVTNGEIVSC